jgi:hypothetical protein
MKRLIVCLLAALGMCATAFGSVTFTLNPTSETYPFGALGSTCQTYSLSSSSSCVIFSGTLTDTDTDGSLTSLNSISILYGSPGDASYFTIDNVFNAFVPAVLEGDTLDSIAPNSYTGAIFGVDVLPTTPLGVYNETIDIAASGGTNDPNGNGFDATTGFTIDIVLPEPASGLMTLGGLLTIAVLLRARRSRTC